MRASLETSARRKSAFVRVGSCAVMLRPARRFLHVHRNRLPRLRKHRKAVLQPRLPLHRPLAQLLSRLLVRLHLQLAHPLLRPNPLQHPRALPCVRQRLHPHQFARPFPRPHLRPCLCTWKLRRQTKKNKPSRFYRKNPPK